MEAMMNWVQWAKLQDADGNPTLLIGAAYYPQEIARAIANEIITMLKDADADRIANPSGTKGWK
jgi:hypothetical protein